MEQTTKLSRWPDDLSAWPAFTASASWRCVCSPRPAVQMAEPARRPTERVELSESEIDALASQAKSFHELRHLVKQKSRERLGIEIPTDKTKKVPKKSRR